MRELLTVELVPKSCWYSNVRSNISNQEWDKIRKKVYSQAGNVCEICGGRGRRWPVECHEMWLYDDEQHIQKLVKLVALCPSCHEVKHMGLAGISGREDAAMAHLAKVNNWSRTDAQHYVEAAFETWQQRSRQQWTLDISYLAQFGITVPATIPSTMRK